MQLNHFPYHSVSLKLEDFADHCFEQCESKEHSNLASSTFRHGERFFNTRTSKGGVHLPIWIRSLQELSCFYHCWGHWYNNLCPSKKIYRCFFLFYSSWSNEPNDTLFDLCRLIRIIFWLPILGVHSRGHLMSKYGCRLTR